VVIKALKNLTVWTLLAGLLGYLSAISFGDPEWVRSSAPPDFYQLVLILKTLFLNSLKMLVAPIVFFSLMAGLLNIRDANRLQTLGGVTIGYYLCTTVIAIVIGLTIVFFIHPWEGTVAPISIDHLGQHEHYVTPNKIIDHHSDSLLQVIQQLLSIAFTNPFAALANLNILGIATNALLIGLAMVLVVPQNSPLVTGIRHINKVLHQLIGWVMRIAPLGIYAIIFDVTLKSGGALIDSLLGFCAVVVGGTLVHGLLILPVIARLLAGVGPARFVVGAGKPLLVAFATSSSSATLPISLQSAQTHFGISATVAGFVFPLGATMNMDGTALYEGIAAVFLAYLFGIDLSSTAVIAIFIMAMVSSIGAPGMPSGSMAGMQMVLLGAGIPLEAIGILLVVERPLDMIRTAVNVEGDMVGALVTQRFFNGETAVTQEIGDDR